MLITVKEIRNAIEGLPDDAQVMLRTREMYEFKEPVHVQLAGFTRAKTAQGGYFLINLVVGLDA